MVCALVYRPLCVLELLPLCWSCGIVHWSVGWCGSLVVCMYGCGVCGVVVCVVVCVCVCDGCGVVDSVCVLVCLSVGLHIC